MDNKQSAALEALDKLGSCLGAHGQLPQSRRDMIDTIRHALTKIQPEQVEGLRKALEIVAATTKVTIGSDSLSARSTYGLHKVATDALKAYSDGGGK